jgi:hypothetical protein
VFVWFLIYETKGLTLEEVDTMYHETSSAHASKHWRPTHHFGDDDGLRHRGAGEKKAAGGPNSHSGDSGHEHHEIATA